MNDAEMQRRWEVVNDRITKLSTERDEARYQIERAIAQLEALPGVEADLNIPTIHGVKSVIAQLRAYEESVR